MREPRLIPIVIFATFSLLLLKTIGFVAGEGAPPPPLLASAEEALRQRLAPYLPRGYAFADADPIVTGATPAPKGAPPAKGAPAPQAAPGIQHPAAKNMVKTPPPQIPANLPPAKSQAGQSQAERALIERLQERRQELDARARDLEMRENLLKAAEQRLEGRLGQLKGLESGEEAPARIKSLVVMYEAMRPRDAARIFDRLDNKVLVEVVNQMNPRKVAEIMAQMQPDTAERLTLEIARRKPEQAKDVPPTDLRRIEEAKKR